jgi:hypothetical protein
MSLLLRITDAGRQALVNADNIGTLPITIDKIAIGSAKYVTTDNQTALQQPIKLIDTFGGGAVADDVIHISVFDDSNEEYPLGEFALITNTGVFFAVCSDHDDYIMTKNAAGILLLAADIKVSTVNAGDIIFDGINFVLPPGTTETAGLLRLADFEETIEGENNSKAVTPAGLKAILDLVLAGKLNIDDLEDHPAIIKLMENTMQPIGTTVENYLGANDPDAESWVRMGDNVTADISLYPKLANLQSPGSLIFSDIPGNNLADLYTAVSGTWHIVCWRVVNGRHVVIARDSAGTNTFYRSFYSSNGITFVEGGQLPVGAAVGTVSQGNLYFFNNKYFLVNHKGIYSSTDLITWTKVSSNYYYSMFFRNGVYLFGDTNGKIYRSTDLVTFTLVFTGATNGVVVNIDFLKGRYYAFMFGTTPQFRFYHSADSTNWTEVVVTTYTHTANISYSHGRELDGKILLIGDTQNVTLQSSDGLTGWSVAPTIIPASAGYDNGTLVAGDTLYAKNMFTTDPSLTPRISTSGNSSGGGFCSDGTNIWAGSVGTSTLTLKKAPLTNNKGKVYLPNVNNRMMKVK